MSSFKEYFLCEVKASRANIDLFQKKYRDLGDYIDDNIGDEFDPNVVHDFVVSIFDRFTVQAKRKTLPNKDIFGYKSFLELLSGIESSESQMSKGENDLLATKEGIKLYGLPARKDAKDPNKLIDASHPDGSVFGDFSVTIVHPTTHRASQKYAYSLTGNCKFPAQWCTAGRSPEHFNSYTNNNGIVLVAFLPKGPVDVPGLQSSVRETRDDPATIDYIILHYPEAFEWTSTSFSRSVGKYISAAYMRGEQPESLDTIAGWSTENARAVELTRMHIKDVIRAWNESGGIILRDVFGNYAMEGPEPQSEEGIVARAGIEEGLTGLLVSMWGDVEPNDSMGEPGDAYAYVKSVMEQLHQGGSNAESSQQSDDNWTAVTVAIAPMGGESEGYGEIEKFGSLPAEAFLKDDSSIEPSAVINAFGLTPEMIENINDYAREFSTNKIWEDKDPNKVFTYMERKENQTPENLANADAFYLNDEDAMFSAGAWNYGSDIRGNVGLGRIGSLAGADTATKKPWKELEEAFIKRLDELVYGNDKDENDPDYIPGEQQVKKWMVQKQTWEGNREIAAHLEKQFGRVNTPEPAKWVNDQFKEWYSQNQKSNRFLGLGTGLLGYMFKVKKYNWTDLEDRILNPDYFATGLIKMGPDWIQHGRGGDRWEEFEDVLFKLWKDITEKPFRNQKDWDMASALPSQQGGSTPHWERTRAKENIADHMNLYGDVENVIDLVKATKRSYGGGTGGSERAAWEEARDAWWNRPEIVALYWGGEGVIAKKQKPGEKKRGKPATKYFVNRNGYVSRPFYHDVRPGAWLNSIPNIFTISNSHVDAQYIGQYGGEDAEMSIGNMIDRHEGNRRAPARESVQYHYNKWMQKY